MTTSWRESMSLPQAQRMTSHVRSLASAVTSLRLAVIHTYTSNLLDPWLEMAAALQGMDLSVYHAPYGLALQEARPDSQLLRHRPDVTLLLLRREDLHPDLGKPLAGLSVQQQRELREEVVDRLLGIVGQFRSHPIGQIVLTLLPAMHAPGLGVYDAQFEASESAWWAGLKKAVGDSLRDTLQSSLLLDLDEVLQQLGRQSFFDLKYWYSARFPFSPDAAREIARRVIGVGSVIKLPKAKVIVLDADNTLWGGIIGEDGIDGIALGPDYPGNAFMDFQRRLLDYQQRGLILALCSKNNPSDLDQVLQQHPHQVLRDEHFAARRVNWLPKPDNLVSLAEELSLGLDSFVFVDDSAHECAAVRHRLPQVEVIQAPANPVLLPACLEHVARLEILALTDEDKGKTELYAQERRRRELSQDVERGGGNLDSYLKMLKMSMRVGFNPLNHLTRLSQLTQKTNQFNLTTRRYNEHQMQEFIVSDSWLVADFSLTDIFGDSGIVGLALFRLVDTRRAELDNFLMSCRVIGREAEAAFLHTLLRHLADRGISEVTAEFLPTKKNDLARDFLPSQGFAPDVRGRYTRDLSKTPPRDESEFPIAINLAESVGT